MPEEDIVDPRVVPRWVEAGVSGVPRGREWDAVAVVDLPELADAALSEIRFRVLEDGSISGAEGAAVPDLALRRLAAAVEEMLSPPYEALAARRGCHDWSIAARELRLEGIELPAALAAGEIVLAVPPGGERTLLVEGEEPAVMTPELEAAAAELERRGLARFDAFVARAERVGGRWELTIDPL